MSDKTEEMVRAMVWVVSAAAEHALEHGWTSKNFLDVAAYIFEIERLRHFRACAFRHFERVRMADELQDHLLRTGRAKIARRLDEIRAARGAT